MHRPRAATRFPAIMPAACAAACHARAAVRGLPVGGQAPLRSRRPPRDARSHRVRRWPCLVRADAQSSARRWRRCNATGRRSMRRASTKWLEVAARFPKMPPDERQTRAGAHDRVGAHDAARPGARRRLDFQEAQRVAPQERQAKWDAYQALPPEQRRQLAASPNRPRQRRSGAPSRAPAATPCQVKSNIVPNPVLRRAAEAGRTDGRAGTARRHHPTDVQAAGTTAAPADRHAEDRRNAGLRRPCNAAAAARAAGRRNAIREGSVRSAAERTDTNDRLGAARPSASRHPSLRRRLACFVYEGVLLFGVLMIAGYLFSDPHAAAPCAAAAASACRRFLFVVLGIYFTWFWSHGGQTLAMKTWHIRVVDRDGAPLSRAARVRALSASWLWFVPALLDRLALRRCRAPRRSRSSCSSACSAYALLARLHPTAAVLARRAVRHAADHARPPAVGCLTAHRKAQSAPMTNPFKGRTGIDRVIRATGYSIDGLRTAYRGESAFRQEFWLRSRAAAGGVLGRPQLDRSRRCWPARCCSC